MIRHRVALVVGVVLALLAIPFAAPIGLAQACGCGAFSPTRGGQASVPKETGLVRITGRGSEDIYLSLTLDSDVRSGALLFPVPDKHATVTAGPRDMFAALARITAPPAIPSSEPRGSGNGAGAPAPTVVVENRQAIGPLDVVTLSSNDAGALTTWLTGHGFNAKPQLATAAAAYIGKGWAFVAVRLNPSAASSGSLNGQLDPLHLHFATSEIVYPMRLSHLASAPEQVTVYTLAPHSMTLRTANPGMTKVWANHVPAGSGSAVTPLLTGGTTFLTRYDGTLRPATITDDFHFTSDPADTVVRPSASVPTEGLGEGNPFTRTSKPSDNTGEITLVVLGSLLLLGILATAVVITQRRTRGQRL